MLIQERVTSGLCQSVVDKIDEIIVSAIMKEIISKSPSAFVAPRSKPYPVRATVQNNLILDFQIFFSEKT